MPDKRPSGGSPPKPPMPLPKTVGEASRQVHFESTKSKQPNGIRPYQATVEEIEDDHVVHHRPMKTAAEKGKTVEQPSTDKHKDIQPSVFPAVGAPPHTHAGAGPWLMAPNPAQSLGWPAGGQMYGGQQFQPGMAAAMPPWAGVHGPLLADGSPAAQFYAPPSHLVNNIAYSAFTPPFFQQPSFGAVQLGQPGYVVAQQPAIVPQPMIGQAPMMMGQAFPGGPPMAMGAGPGMPVMNGNSGVPVIAGNGCPPPPDVSGLGKTQGEETVRQVEFAHANKLFEPQDFKPADDDPSRYYYVREVDGNWTQRNRFTIDHMGDCRWYVTDEGWFYAVRLPD